jgi:hypothetical protein
MVEPTGKFVVPEINGVVEVVVLPEVKAITGPVRSTTTAWLTTAELPAASVAVAVRV